MKLRSIQILRAIAALLVVYVHSIDLQMGFGVSKQQDFFYLQNFGAIGVDLFFVISGFIITYVANKYSGVEQGYLFLIKRFKRINPVYYIASVLFFAISILQMWATQNSVNILWERKISSFFDTILIIPVSGNILFGYSPLLVIGWSLAFEWLFYTLFFLLIVSKTKNKPLLFGLLICGLVALGHVLKIPDFRYIFITNPIMLEFLLGVGICQLHLKGLKIPIWIPMICLSTGITIYILLIVLGYGWISELGAVLSGALSMKRFILWGIPSAFIAFGCIFLEKSNRFTKLWNNKLLLLLGDASYSIYLVHLTVFSLLAILYEKTFYFMPPDAAIIVQVTIATIISVFFYKWVEKPLTELVKKKATKTPHSVPAIP